MYSDNSPLNGLRTLPIVLSSLAPTRGSGSIDLGIQHALSRGKAVRSQVSMRVYERQSAGNKDRSLRHLTELFGGQPRGMKAWRYTMLLSFSRSWISDRCFLLQPLLELFLLYSPISRGRARLAR